MSALLKSRDAGLLSFRYGMEKGTYPFYCTISAASITVTPVATMLVFDCLFMDLIFSKGIFVTRSVKIDDVAIAWVLQDWVIPG